MMGFNVILALLCGWIFGICVSPVMNQTLASKRCEFEDNYKAKCTDKFLISAQLDGLPFELRVLNLDRNQISSLENNAFWRTVLLVDLSIAHNKLDTIYMDAFKDLNSLKRLNLSYNRLESLNEFLLDTLAVEVLDLSGNNFMDWEGKLAFKSNSLMELYLKNCKILILNGMFNHLPSLQKIDLSNNLLKSLDIPTFVPARDLKFVNLENNYLSCDKPTQYLMDWFRKYSITYEGPFCAIQRKDMFQRMEMSLDKITEKDIEENDLLRNTSLAKINATQVEKELVMSLFNKTYFKRCLLMDHEFVCHMLENCKENMNYEKFIEEQKKHNKLNFYFVIVIFVIGVFIGCILALCCCQACMYCRMDKQRSRKRRVHNQNSYQDVQLRPMEEGHIRRGRYRSGPGDERDTQSTTVNSRALVESNGFHDLVNDLFSRRRSRRQMISAIGQQGTNLVRQLSRSSMNLLRRTQSRAANASARAAGPVLQQQSQAPSSGVYEPIDFPPMRERSRSFTYSTEMVNRTNTDYLIDDLVGQQRMRSESPPPNYDLCVRLPKDGYVSE